MKRFAPRALAFAIGLLLLIDRPTLSQSTTNVFPSGAFENIDTRGVLLDWKPISGDTVRLVEEGSNHYCVLTATNGQRPIVIGTKLPLDQSWRKLKVSARLRARNMQPGEQAWQNARIMLRFEEETGKPLSFPSCPQLGLNSDWVTLSTTFEVPAGATTLAVEPGVYGPAGELSVDDITVVPNPPIEALPIQAGFPEGTFEQLEADGSPIGWKLPKQSNVKIIEENGNHFLRLVNEKSGSTATIEDNRFTLDPKWKTLKVSARLRSKDLRAGTNAVDGARLQFMFEDANGKMLGGWPPAPGLRQDSDWITKTVRASIPPGAMYVKLLPALYNATGTFDIDDVQIGEAPALEALPLTADFPEGTFEKLDDAGRPQGWRFSDPKLCSVIADGSNHFLRVTNGALGKSVQAQGRFQLDPKWTSLKVTVRMRAINLQLSTASNAVSDARLQFVFEDAHGKRVGGWPKVPSLKENSAWIVKDAVNDIPKGSVYIVFAPALYNATGTLDVDDIMVEPKLATEQPAPPAAVPATSNPTQ
ncbi:MAG TPA: hypothetical protein VNL17_02980 [Verrucomicrobiae bacterium]|nr:hypothetical protein [Verrucomicrobiae bacterium]